MIRLLDRQRVRDFGDPFGTAFTVGGKLFDSVAGRGWFAGGLSGHATGRRLRSDRQVAARPFPLRYVDLFRRPLLHGLHSSSGCHSNRQVHPLSSHTNTVSSINSQQWNRCGPRAKFALALTGTRAARGPESLPTLALNGFFPSVLFLYVFG